METMTSRLDIEGCDSFLDDVSLLFLKHNVDILDMNENLYPKGDHVRNHKLASIRVDLFYAIIDMQLKELNN